MMTDASKTALILFAHGSRDPEWASTLKRVSAAVEAQAPRLLLKLAFLELMPPTLRESCEALIADGAERIIVLPMFIAQGGHLKQDLPEQLDELRALYPHINFEQEPPVGEAETVIQAMAAHVLALAK
ncbi:sirohydrochlorin chelatase [Propionivibrio limicola]|uniref:sirohydrochlorin chelatase n=1 Tax=Propionivibrio limicola TaxID=167645 RepID=UPI001FE2C15F|nr:CbiX/SirB N-terminal domain-containing protein [Propionivibrio limicola]